MERRFLIQQTISTIEDAIAHLEDERTKIEYEVREKQGLLNNWRMELAQLEKGKSGQQRERAPRGQALRVINEWFDKDQRAQQNGLTMKQIADATNLNWSTVRNVVKKPANGFIEQDGKIRRSPEIDRQRRLKAVS